jgi:thioredoxin-related protein
VTFNIFYGLQVSSISYNKLGDEIIKLVYLEQIKFTMKKNLLLIIFLINSIIGMSQETPKALYHPEDNGKKEIETAVKKAKMEGKHVLLQIGGNWCKWCIEFNRFVHEDFQLDSLVNSNYVVYHLNYSKENKNEELLKELGFPQRFGFPVFVVLDEKGNYLHTENSVYLEEGKGYSKEKVFNFLKNWNPASLSPLSYKNK